MTGIDTLSPRQMEILRLVARHYQHKEIARRLNICVATVKAHAATARRRLNVATTREAALLLAEYETDMPIPPEGGGLQGGWRRLPTMCHPQDMNAKLDLKNYCITISYSALEQAWQNLSVSNKRHLIPEMLDALKTRNKSAGSTAAVGDLVAMTSWLCSDDPDPAQLGSDTDPARPVGA